MPLAFAWRGTSPISKIPGSAPGVYRVELVYSLYPYLFLYNFSEEQAEDFKGSAYSLTSISCSTFHTMKFTPVLWELRHIGAGIP